MQTCVADDKISSQVFLAQVRLERPSGDLHAVRGFVPERLAQFGVSVLDDEAGIAIRRKLSEEIL